MKTLYDIQSETHGQFRSKPYTVNGLPGQLPDNVIELDVVYSDYPQGDIVITKTDWVADIELKQYRQVYEYREMTEQEIALREWKHEEYAIRINAPLALMMPSEQNTLFHQFYGWFAAQKFPIDRDGGYVRIWCHTILEPHQAIMDDLVLQGVITIDDRP